MIVASVACRTLTFYPIAHEDWHLDKVSRSKCICHLTLIRALSSKLNILCSNENDNENGNCYACTVNVLSLRTRISVLHAIIINFWLMMMSWWVDDSHVLFSVHFNLRSFQITFGLEKIDAPIKLSISPHMWCSHARHHERHSHAKSVAGKCQYHGTVTIYRSRRVNVSFIEFSFAYQSDRSTKNAVVGAFSVCAARHGFACV